MADLEGAGVLCGGANRPDPSVDVRKLSQVRDDHRACRASDPVERAAQRARRGLTDAGLGCCLTVAG